MAPPQDAPAGPAAVGTVTPLRPTVAGVLELLPRGHGLPAHVWETRHRWVVRTLLLSTALLPPFGLARGLSVTHSLLEGVGPALMVAIASAPGLGPRIRSSLSAVGLMVVASLAVHVADGSIEAHFLFFVMVPVVALYESWIPFGLAVGYVLFHHGVIGTLHARAVFDHASAERSPWLWAGIHAALFAACCLGSIVNWRLHEQAREDGQRLSLARAALEEQVCTDPLTGLRNRLGLGADLDHVQAVSERHERSYCVAMLDIDNFKAYNDIYGHVSGDQALRTVADTLTASLRRTDSVYRYGGEEFLVLLPDQSLDEAARAVERVRSRLQSLAVEHRGAGPEGVLTVSTGVACSAPGRRRPASLLVADADAALYEAKRAGRNRSATAHATA